MHDNKLYYNEESDEKYMHPNEEAHIEWAKILFNDIENTRNGEG